MKCAQQSSRVTLDCSACREVVDVGQAREACTLAVYCSEKADPSVSDSWDDNYLAWSCNEALE
jgi:hypothetical protein